MTLPLKIVIDDAVPFATEMFSHLGEVVCLPGKAIQQKDLINAQALIVRSRTQINQALLHNTSVQFVGSTVVGLDHIDQPYLQQQGITFYSAQGCNANSVAEYVITCILNHAQQYAIDLSQKSIGIIGVGHVGKQLQIKAEALGLTILPNDPPRQETETHSFKVPFVSLEKALSADIVSFHTPLTHQGRHASYHLLSQHNIHLITPNTLLINAARGGIINEEVWLKTPTAGNIIDCWENEPNISKALYDIADIATPHIAGHALEAKIKGSQMVYSQLCQHLKQPEQTDWKSYLPAPPPPIVWPTTIKNQPTPLQQACLQAIIEQCYQPQLDHDALSSSKIGSIHKKFEYYRRHYPIHREWTEHKVCPPLTHNQTNLLKTLGFNSIQQPDIRN